MEERRKKGAEKPTNEWMNERKKKAKLTDQYISNTFCEKQVPDKLEEYFRSSGSM